MVKKQSTFADDLRAAIERSDKTRYAISKETGIAESTLSRFMHSQCGLSLPSVDLLCKCLGLRLASEDELRTKKGR